MLSRIATLLFPLPLCLLLASCAGSTATLPPRHPTPAPANTPTVTTSFAVQVTPPPPPPKPHATPTATTIPHPASSGPFLVVAPSSGPPLSRAITVHAGNLPKNTPVMLSWSSGSKESALTTQSSTGRNGQLSTTFQIPAAQPGRYHLVLEAQGIRYATASYTIISQAAIVAGVASSDSGDRVQVRGRHFVAHTSLELVAYPLLKERKPFILGSASTRQAGTFLFSRTTRKLAPGEYLVRAISTNSLIAETASTYLQVVV